MCPGGQSEGTAASIFACSSLFRASFLSCMYLQGNFVLYKYKINVSIDCRRFLGHAFFLNLSFNKFKQKTGA